MKKILIPIKDILEQNIVKYQIVIVLLVKIIKKELKKIKKINYNYYLSNKIFQYISKKLKMK